MFKFFCVVGASFGLRYVSWYKYLIVGLVFSHLGFWSGNLFPIALFPDLCLLVPLNIYIFIAIALDESIFLDVLHFPMKNIKSRDLEATPMGGATSKSIQ